MQQCDRAVATRASSAAAGDALPTGPARLEKLADVLTMMFPLWALVSGVVAGRRPASLNWITGAQFEAGCVSNPVPILCGFAAQYAIMPSLALAISRALGLSPGLSVGLILLGCCPGGQASNIATYVANGDVALSVIMTAASTLAATVMTPLLTSTLAGRFVPVSTAALAASTVKLVLLPTLAGVVLNETLPGLVGRVRPAMPLLAILLTVVLCATPVAQVAPLLALHGASACLPVLLLHTLGYFFGYLLPRVLGFGERTSRTVSIETGMQSAAMGYALSTKHFADVLVAMPSAVSILFMVWIGAALAVVWRLVPIKDDRHAA
ncbi:putative sodium-dependent transporter YocS [Auxenochlorella protothecoides]|uniref:Putative sodium-dependent transporter YocS n=1 Tax=Auxenochlorella protothecoides TaxID=3075 RepID=A0A087SDH5_AUXPR|nr:putative sodium-dependent transporter YocS [Auxenochlorella protothecoides]KFM23779.1 putative sodium-dependent transporter YocS [Auxenochlorella protothecoides]